MDEPSKQEGVLFKFWALLDTFEKQNQKCSLYKSS